MKKRQIRPGLQSLAPEADVEKPLSHARCCRRFAIVE